MCEGLLPNNRFQGTDTVCKVCRARIKEQEEVEYGQPGNKTIRQAYTDLLLAIRRQAEMDGELEEWESFWIRREPWKRIWKLLRETMDHAESVRSDLRSQIGGRR